MEQKDRLRRFTFNLHDWDVKGITKENLIEQFTNGWAVDYMIVGEELTPTGDTPHLQGYVEFRNPATWEQVRERFIAVCGYVSDLQQSKGDAKSNQLYCKKADKYLEYGSFTEKVLFDDIAVNVVKQLDEGVPLLMILKNNNAYAQYIVKNFTQLQKIESSIIADRYFEINEK